MKLEKAIEISNDLVHTFQSFRTPDDVAAIKLGREALKRIQFSREADEAFYRLPLPGEDPQ